MGHTFTFNEYEEAKKTTKIISCDECGKSWVFKETSTQKDKITIKGVHLQVTYFTCPYCNKLYVVSIDNNETLQLRQKLLLETKRITKDRNLGKDVSKRVRKVQILYQTLKDKNEVLKHIYNGTFYQKSTT